MQSDTPGVAMNIEMTYEEWCKLYDEAADCMDWQTCDALAENYPDHADEYFRDIDGDVE
jgi:hypothetical protein